MTQGKQETREEEVARIRSYLVSQAIRRTPEQLVQALREAHHQFLAATAAIPWRMFAPSPPSMNDPSAAFLSVESSPRMLLMCLSILQRMPHENKCWRRSKRCVSS